MSTADSELLRKRLVVTAALRRVAERELERAVYQAATNGGFTEVEISEIVGIYVQPTVHRILRRLSEDPSRLTRTPAEIIDRRAANLIDGEEMMSLLLSRKYSFGRVVRLGGAVLDAYEGGDWDDVEIAFHRGLLDHDEFRQLAMRHLKGM
ncbi:winged helix-turn-helix domain-containing protein [Mycolicibacterium boenickei]